MTTYRRWLRAALLALIGFCNATPVVSAAEVLVLSTTSTKEALTELAPMFERLSGHSVRLEFVGGTAMAERIRTNATGDVLVGPEELSDTLLREGRLVAGSRVNFARSVVAVAVRAGAEKPDVSSPEAFKRTMSAARSFSYSKGVSGQQFVELMTRLGFADAVKQKSVLPKAGEVVGEVVARGAAELGVQQLSELLPVPGIDIAGLVPSELQPDILYGASIVAGSKSAEAAKALAEFLRSPEAIVVLKKHGFKEMSPGP